MRYRLLVSQVLCSMLCYVFALRMREWEREDEKRGRESLALFFMHCSESAKIEQLLTLPCRCGGVALDFPNQSQMKHLLFKINVQKESLLRLQRVQCSCGETGHGDGEIAAAALTDISANLQP